MKHAQLIEGPRILKAVIYCRVSSPNQVAKGDGLNSQETRCRVYAQQRGLEVEAVFKDNETGGVADRHAMNELVRHLRKHRKEGRIVIIDDITRFARGVVTHWQLRDQVKEAGGILESPSLQFGDDPHSKFLENVLASAAQFGREFERASDQGAHARPRHERLLAVQGLHRLPARSPAGRGQGACAE